MTKEERNSGFQKMSEGGRKKNLSSVEKKSFFHSVDGEYVGIDTRFIKGDRVENAENINGYRHWKNKNKGFSSDDVSEIGGNPEKERGKEKKKKQIERKKKSRLKKRCAIIFDFNYGQKIASPDIFLWF